MLVWTFVGRVEIISNFFFAFFQFLESWLNRFYIHILSYKLFPITPTEDARAPVDLLIYNLRSRYNYFSCSNIASIPRPDLGGFC